MPGPFKVDFMKKSVITFFSIVLVIIALHAFRALQQSTITGKIFPANAATTVWAINGNHLLKVTPQNGSFELTVPPGSWSVMVEANKPYENFKTPALVEEGKTKDLGIIRLY